MSTNDADLEYGPTPEHSEYEHTDIEPSIAGKFAIWLCVAMIISAGIVYGTFWFFEGMEKDANTAARVFPLAVGQTRQPQGPQLQNQPFKDIYMLRQGEAEKLSSYGWVDKDGGIARLPIDRAIDVMLEKGFPARAEGGNALNVVTQDSSSGRTVVPR